MRFKYVSWSPFTIAVINDVLLAFIKSRAGKLVKDRGGTNVFCEDHMFDERKQDDNPKE